MRSRVLWDALVAGLVACCVILIFESALRAAGIHFQASFYAKERQRGYAFRPLARGWETAEGRNYVTINSRGYHDREHNICTNPGEVRIAVLGSSYVAGLNIPLQRNFIAVMERALNSRPAAARRVEAFNFGVEAYSEMQAWQTLEKDVWQYHPDVVLLALTNLDPLEAYRGSAISTSFEERPYFSVDASGQIVRDRPLPYLLHPNSVTAENWRNDLINRSEMAVLCRQVLVKAGRKIRLVPGVGPGVRSDFPIEQPQRILDGVLEGMKKEATAHGAELYVFAIPLQEQVNPDAEVRAAIQRATESVVSKTLFFSEAHVNLTARKHGISNILLSPYLASYASTHHVYLHGFYNTSPGVGHWNETGNRVTGEYLANQLAAASPWLQ